MKKFRGNSTLLCYSENAEVELRKLMSDLPMARLFLLIASDLLDVQSRLLLFCGVAWRFGKKKPLAHHEKKKSNH